MITGKIVLKSATKLSLDQRFGEIAKQAPPPQPRIPQQTNVIIPQFRQELFGNKRSAAVSLANRLKKRSINYRRGNFNNIAPARPFVNPRPAHVFQRIGFGNRRRGGGASSYVFGGQSGMGVRLGGDGRVGTRVFHSQRRGYLNNNAVSRFGRYQRRGYNNNVGNRGGRFFNRPYRGRGIGRGFGRGAGRGADRGAGRGNRGFGRGRGRGNNRNNPNCTKESLDNDLDKYMSQTKIDNDSVDMSAI